ncbi:MAG: hypothetical protein HDR01_04470 [Lachnospiraceae bacterium]|nr:hypothetical protein [Lachnospiraceae bacterium]
MKFYYIIISAFLILFFPRQITNVICFGRHRDQINVKSKAAYWGIYSFWTVVFLIGCLFMGSAAGVDTTIDKLVYYFILGSGNEDYIELASEEDDEAYILTYYTREEINEDVLYDIVQNNRFIYKTYRLEDLKIEQIDKKKWGLYLDSETMGYIEVKKGFLLNEIYYRWYKKNLEQRG